MLSNAGLLVLLFDRSVVDCNVDVVVASVVVDCSFDVV